MPVNYSFKGGGAVTNSAAPYDDQPADVVGTTDRDDDGAMTEEEFAVAVKAALDDAVDYIDGTIGANKPKPPGSIVAICSAMKKKAAANSS